MGNEKKSKKPNKIFALITYFIALVCLLLGLFLPSDFANPVDSMLGLQIPAAFDSIWKIGETGLQGMFGTPDFAYNFPFNVAGWPEGGINLAAILVVLYALVTLAGVVALIPVCVSAFSGKKGKKKSKDASTDPETTDETADRKSKKDKNVALRAASFIEVLAIATLSTFVIILFNQFIIDGKAIADFTNYGLISAIGGTLLMLIVQAIFYKGGSGLVKFLLALMSAVVVIFIYGIPFMLPFLTDFASGLNLTLYTSGETAADVLGLINSLFTKGLAFEGREITVITLELAAVTFGYLAFVNLVLDLMGLGKKTNKFMLVVNIIRYTLEVAALIVIVVTTFFAEGVALGNFVIIAAILALISHVINVFRVALLDKKKAKAAGKKKAKKSKETAKPTAEKTEKPEKKKKPHAEEQPARAVPVADTKAAPTVENTERLYTPIIYQGPTDDFIRTLANEQKVEFSRVFLERQNGPISCIPDYTVGGKNEKFFTSIFIYYARIRDLVSDELMNMLYKQANMM